MTKSSKNEIDMLNVINQLQEQLIALDRKVDILINRSLPETKPAPKPPQGREKYQAICADCKKECTIPFRPSGDRPVYCQDCFSRRKVISMSGIKLHEKPKEAEPVPTVTKKAVSAKKPVAKKKATPKKK